MEDQAKPYRYQFSSSTDYAITKDTELWRYLTFEKFFDLFEFSYLHHTRLDCLGDPFEGSVTKAYAALRDSGQSIGYLSNPEMEPLNNRRLRLCTFASCWHASENESDAMWKLYSRKEGGVAIVSTPALMIEAVDLGQYHDGEIAPIEYLDFNTHDMRLPFGKTARPGLIKRKSFEHEKEVRALIRLPALPEKPENIFSEEWVNSLADGQRGVDVLVNVPVLIKRIHISPLAPVWFSDLVLAVAKRHELQRRVRRSILEAEPVY